MELESLSNSFMMATNTSYHRVLSRYASGMNFMDQINIFDIQNPERSISISTHNERKSAKEAEETPMPEKMEYYFDIRSTNDYLLALYVNQNRKDWAMENTPGTIQIFDWHGNPIIEAITKEKIIQFDIDTINNRIYEITAQDELFVYEFELPKK